MDCFAPLAMTMRNTKKGSREAPRFRLFNRNSTHEQPVVLPQVSHFRHVPLRTSVKLAHSGQLSPT